MELNGQIGVQEWGLFESVGLIDHLRYINKQIRRVGSFLYTKSLYYSESFIYFQIKLSAILIFFSL